MWYRSLVRNVRLIYANILSWASAMIRVSTSYIRVVSLHNISSLRNVLDSHLSYVEHDILCRFPIFLPVLLVTQVIVECEQWVFLTGEIEM